LEIEEIGFDARFGWHQIVLLASRLGPPMWWALVALRSVKARRPGRESEASWR